MMTGPDHPKNCLDTRTMMLNFQMLRRCCVLHIWGLEQKVENDWNK